ncbi:uncharacterized protein stbd1 [Stigmatopora nigra]
MAFKGSDAVAAERRVDLESLLCVIGRHGPVVAMALFALLSALAAFVIYRAVRGRSDRTEPKTSEPAGTEPQTPSTGVCQVVKEAEQTHRCVHPKRETLPVRRLGRRVPAPAVRKNPPNEEPVPAASVTVTAAAISHLHAKEDGIKEGEISGETLKEAHLCRREVDQPQRDHCDQRTHASEDHAGSLSSRPLHFKQTLPSVVTVEEDLEQVQQTSAEPGTAVPGVTEEPAVLTEQSAKEATAMEQDGAQASPHWPATEEEEVAVLTEEKENQAKPILATQSGSDDSDAPPGDWPRAGGETDVLPDQKRTEESFHSVVGSEDDGSTPPFGSNNTSGADSEVANVDLEETPIMSDVNEDAHPTLKEASVVTVSSSVGKSNDEEEEEEEEPASRQRPNHQGAQPFSWAAHAPRDGSEPLELQICLPPFEPKGDDAGGGGGGGEESGISSMAASPDVADPQNPFAVVATDRAARPAAGPPAQEKSENGDDPEDEGGRAKTEINIMEATMELNEWMADEAPRINNAAQEEWDPGQRESQGVRVTFRLHYVTPWPSQTLAVTGDRRELGNWEEFVPLEGHGDGHWAGAVALPPDTRVHWKFVVVEGGRVRRWEECADRLLHTGRGPELPVVKRWGHP